MNIEELVRMQKKFTKVYHSTPLVSITADGVYIRGLANLRELMPAYSGCELVTTSRGDSEYPFKSFFEYKGVRFFSIYKE